MIGKTEITICYVQNRHEKRQNKILQTRFKVDKMSTFFYCIWLTVKTVQSKFIGICGDIFVIEFEDLLVQILLTHCFGRTSIHIYNEKWEDNFEELSDHIQEHNRQF